MKLWVLTPSIKSRTNSQIRDGIVAVTADGVFCGMTFPLRLKYIEPI
ncbi:hypothetical protein GS682_32425 [Nostoc sp. B(2019)]|nr:hypothetical protein [Nostoc sp. B(2019)]